MHNTHLDLTQIFLEMRWRCLSLAADLDRLDRAAVRDDVQLEKFRKAVQILLETKPDRAARLQLLYSDPLATSN